VDEKTYAQQLDLLRFQVREIADAKLRPTRRRNLSRITSAPATLPGLLELSQTALNLLERGGQLAAFPGCFPGPHLAELQRLDAAAGPLAALHQQAVTALGELQAELSRYTDRVELDPAPARVGGAPEPRPFVSSGAARRLPKSSASRAGTRKLRNLETNATRN